MTQKTITLGELKIRVLNQLMGLPDETIITFGSGDLSFNQFHSRGAIEADATSPLIQIEFNETYTVHDD